MTKQYTIDITPHKSIFHKIGEANYSISDAIAELVDNSIDASNDDGVNIFVLIDKNKDRIVIEDDGVGMDKEVAAKALVLAYSNKVNVLGEFGLGLKSACTSLGRSFNLTTTTGDSKEEYTLKYNREEFMKTGDWKNFPITLNTSIENKHGTRVEITGLRVKLYDALITRLKKDLALRYGPFISHNNIVIKVGVNKASAKQCIPEVIELNDYGRKEFKYILKNGRKITGWWGLRKIASGTQSGFDLFRRGRLIKAYERLGYNPHPMANHIIGEIHFDPIPVTHNKREFITESGEFREFIEKFWGDKTGVLVGVRAKGKIDEIVSIANEKWNKEKVAKQLPPDLREQIRDSILKAMNRVDDFKELAFPEIPTEKKRSKDGEDGNMEKREDKKVATEEIIEESKSGERKRTPQKIQPRKVKFIIINGKKFKFDIFWQDLGDDNIDKDLAISDKGIEIYINTAFKGFNITNDTQYYCIHHVAEALAQLYLEKSGRSLSLAFELRNKLIYQVASVLLDEEELKKLNKIENDLAKVRKKQQDLLEKTKL